MLLHIPQAWRAFVPWVEQLMEESLGKGGKGVVVFEDQTLNTQAPGYRPAGLLRVDVETDIVQAREPHVFLLYQPLLASEEPRRTIALPAFRQSAVASIVTFGRAS